MTLKKKASLALLAAVCAAAAPARAAFEDMGFGARAPGMGDAFTGVADDISSIYYNPAGLSNVERPKVMASHSMLYSGLSDGSSLGLSVAALAVPLADGREGTLGASWQDFSLSGLYYERTMQLSWGYRFARGTPYEKLSVGGSLKYLSHGFTRPAEAYNAVEPNLSQNGATDPVLAGQNSKSAPDADLGVLYRLNRRWTLGAAILDAMQPNVAFGSGDKDQVPRKYRVGASFKSLWLILAADARMEKAPDGSMDKQLVLAAEKVFPSLDRGDIGVRGSLGAGTRDFRQATLGLSYKIQRIQFDYAFVMPIGTITQTAGIHRLALTYHFGSPTRSEIAEKELLEQYDQLRKAENYKSPSATASLDDPRLAEVKEKVDQEDFYAASKLLAAKAPDLLPDSSVVGLTIRLSAVSAFYPSLAVKGREKTLKEQLLSAGVQNFLNGSDTLALKQLAYAQSLDPQDSALSAFLDRAGEITHIVPDRVPADFGRSWPEYKLSQSDDYYGKKNYTEALLKLQDLLSLAPDDLMALKKSGSCDYMLGDYAGAAAYWRKAAAMETDPVSKAKLLKMIEQADQKRGKESSWQPSAVVQQAQQQAPASPAAAHAREIEKLYQDGADSYAKGDYGKAADSFRKILTLDPQNGQAKKALERIIRLSR